MSSAIAVAEEPRWFSIPPGMRNLSLPIPRPIAWAVSAFIARLKQIDEATALDYNTHPQPTQGTADGPERQQFQQMPTPWTFLTSGYFIGFLIFVRFVTLDH
jgi:hypothetical protein